MTFVIINGNADIIRRRSSANLSVLEGNEDLARGVTLQPKLLFDLHPPLMDRRKIGSDPAAHLRPASRHVARCFRTLKLDFPFLENARTISVDLANLRYKSSEFFRDYMMGVEVNLPSAYIRNEEGLRELHEHYKQPCADLEKALHNAFWNVNFELELHIPSDEPLGLRLKDACISMNIDCKYKIFIKQDIEPYRQVFRRAIPLNY